MARLRSAIRTVLVPIVAISAALALGSWASGREPDTRSSLAASLDVLPAGTRVAGFTDWAEIRRELGIAPGSTAAARDALSSDASLRDLTTRSVLGGSIAPMHELYGWSAADLEWESYGESPAGAAMVARLVDSVSIDEIQSRLGRLGYSRDGEVWTLDEAGSATVGTDLAGTLGQLAFVPRERLVVAARAEFIPEVLDTIRGREASALATRPLADVAAALGGSTTAVLQAGSFGCRATSLDDLGPAVRAQADAAIARSGVLATPTFTGRGLRGRGATQTISFAAAFGSPAQAASQLTVRTALAQGSFIGRSGQIEDTLELEDAKAEGSVATLSFTTDPARAAYMSGEGPLLFAACS